MIGDLNSVTNPISTGGGGTFFEQHVDALFLALLLVRGIPPILKDCQVEEVHLQAGHMGWNTDDLLVIATRGAGEQRKLIMQIKRQFTISEKNEDCRKVFKGFWNDFKHNKEFNSDNDRFALVTSLGTTTLLSDFNNLLNCARSSSNHTDFSHRLALAGYLSARTRNYAGIIRGIIEDIDENVSDTDYWNFLKVLSVISFDLNTSTANNESWIKSLLASTTNDPDPIYSADATWRELLEIAGLEMPAAGSFKRSDMPVSLCNRHAPVEDSSGLQSLSDHTETTLDGINTEIANSVTISRDGLGHKVVECFDQSQIVLVTGPAGSGKSALAKTVLGMLGSDHFVLAFRAEEFAVSHIDQVLLQAQAQINAQKLLSVLAAQGRIIILVESVERLLESVVRDSFTDLLNLARSSRNIQIILTCRDYSVDIIRSALLDRTGLGHGIVNVPPLDDQDLQEVVLGIPDLATPLSNTRLKELLRSPYFLDIAARMDWTDSANLSGDEREFRLKCWSEIVRKNAAAGGGLPQRREVAFQNLAIRRARALVPYVSIADMDPEAMEALKNDSLVSFSRKTDYLAAPAHDVLEDWAILQWLDGLFYLHQNDAKFVSDAVAESPAIRRGYRTWLAEVLEIDSSQADSFVLSTLKDQQLPAQFRDDTLVATLLSSTARDFLTRNSHLVLEDNARLLVRIIHLLRVACKTVPTWLTGADAIPSNVLVARGLAWGAVLEIASESLDDLLPDHLGVLMGLLDDWTSSIGWSTPEPFGLHSAGKIAFWLLNTLDGYQYEDIRIRLLKAIAKMPKSDEAAFEDLLDRGRNLDPTDRNASDLAEILLTELDSGFACRDFPVKIVQLSYAQFCLTDDHVSRYPRYDAHLDVDPYFGIRPGQRTDFFPPSALRGPFLPLLKLHPAIGVDFIVGLTNHAANWYAEQKWPDFRLEPVHEIKIEIPGLGEITQWSNWRFWGLYRGTTVGPYVINSALMALETWLLTLCEDESFNVELLLLKLLKDSNNVAVTAVVASVSNAFPEKCGRAALAVLSNRELIDMDRGRKVGDVPRPKPSDLLPFSSVVAQICGDERKESDSLQHREHDLELLAQKLQFGGQQEAVWQILDRHWEALPQMTEQSEEQQLWRLALHRMDTRGFGRVDDPDRIESPNSVSDSGNAEPKPKFYGPVNLEEDVKKISEDANQRQAEISGDLSLIAWGVAVFQGDQSGNFDGSDWRTKLADARARFDDPRPYEDFARGGPSLVAAVCVLHHLDEINQEEREWCTHRLIEEIESDCDSDDYTLQISKMGYMKPDRSAAYTLPLLLHENDRETDNLRIITALSKAITHASTEVSECAANGIGQHLQGEDSRFALLCAGALAKQSRLVRELTETARAENPAVESNAATKLIAKVRSSIQNNDLDVEAELAQFEFMDRPAAMVCQRILQIFSHRSDADISRKFYENTAASIKGVWDDDAQAPRNRGERNYEFEYHCLEYIARFVIGLPSEAALDICSPLIASMAEHPRDTSRFIEFLVSAENQFDGPSSFWEIWQAFADGLCQLTWVTSALSTSSVEDELVSRIFFGHYWSQDVRYWHRLNGEETRLDSLVKQLPATMPIVRAYVRFLYHIGERSIPIAYVTVVDRLRSGQPREILADENTVFCLESLLQRSVYGEPQRLKSDTMVRSAVLEILDQLVDAGSSAAYRMRDDFVTPVPPNA